MIRQVWVSRAWLVAVVLSVAASHLRADEKKPAEPAKKPAAKITYDEHVLPILREHCGACHNANDRKGGLVVDSYLGIMEGGGSGEVIAPGDPDTSYLMDLITHQVEPYMPPNKPKLPDETIDVIRRWIAGGALENAGSKATTKPKPKLARVEITSGRPEGPPPMPKQLPTRPAVVSQHANSVTALATSPWAPLVAVSGHKQVLLYETKSFALLGVLPFPEGTPHILKFSRDGRLLLAGGGRGGASGRVVVWDVTDGRRVFEIGAEYDVVLAADISPDHSLIALGGPKRMLRVYSTETGELLYESKKHTDWITAVEFSPDGVLLASADRSNGLIIWEADTGREFQALTGHTGMITDVSWRADSNVLASASEDGTIRLWTVENGRQVALMRAHGGVESMEYLRDGRLVTTGRDRRAILWGTNNKPQRTFGGLKDIGMEVAFDVDLDRLLVGDWTGSVYVFNAKDGKLLTTLSTNPPAKTDDVAAKPSGQ